MYSFTQELGRTPTSPIVSVQAAALGRGKHVYLWRGNTNREDISGNMRLYGNFSLCLYRITNGAIFQVSHVTTDEYGCSLKGH